MGRETRESRYRGCSCDRLSLRVVVAHQVGLLEPDGLVDLGRADVPGPWLRAALDGADSFLNHGHIPSPSIVPKILVAMLDPKENPR